MTGYQPGCEMEKPKIWGGANRRNESWSKYDRDDIPKESEGTDEPTKEEMVLYYGIAG